MISTKTAKGDRVEFDIMIGTKEEPRQYGYGTDRVGVYRRVTGTVIGLTHWMDNSVDAEVLTDDGDTVTTQLVYPHGDVCF